MVCLACMQKKTRTSSHPATKKDIGYFYMSYKWAVPTWDFLHSFAAKVNDGFYASNRVQIVQFIIDICMVLPCPTCQQHAKVFFRGVRPQNIRTKDHLIQLLLDFHNDVQRRTGKPQLTLADLTKYKNSVFIKIAHNFVTVFGSYKGALGGGFVDTKTRKNVLSRLVVWINSYRQHFL